eukprot:1158384-Pelagomonas_calceolata.AAC.11
MLSSMAGSQFKSADAWNAVWGIGDGFEVHDFGAPFTGSTQHTWLLAAASPSMSKDHMPA